LKNISHAIKRCVGLLF
jgi:hypothetical protein